MGITPCISTPLTAVYNPKAFIPHAASLRQAFAHCGRFSTAATRRCLGSVSVPVRRATLSRPLPIKVLVGHYPTNKLIGRRTIPRRNHTFGPETLSGITSGFPLLSQTWGQVSYALLSLSPLSSFGRMQAKETFALDLHA